MGWDQEEERGRVQYGMVLGQAAPADTQRKQETGQGKVLHR